MKLLPILLATIIGASPALACTEDEAFRMSTEVIFRLKKIEDKDPIKAKKIIDILVGRSNQLAEKLGFELTGPFQFEHTPENIDRLCTIHRAELDYLDTQE